jgi:predicted dehydrogenase
LPLYLEKPVAVSYRQLAELRDAYRGKERSVVVSFPLRVTPLFAAVMEVVRSGRTGVINQVQAVNNVPYGAEYFGSPAYREHTVTGGLWLQKATHDFDYLNQLMGHPTMITAMMSRKAYGGDMPHNLWCSQCDRAETCVESPTGLERRGENLAKLRDHLCVFGDGIRHQDAGSALIMYESGAHASYSQNFVSRRSAATRGAVITGYKASVSFDWHTDRIKVTDHHADRVDEMTVKATTGHQGGDEALLRNFVDVCLGRDEAHADLNAGLQSVAMCLAARESAHRQAWLPVGDVRSPQFPEADARIHPTPADIEPPVDTSSVELSHHPGGG